VGPPTKTLKFVPRRGRVGGSEREPNRVKTIGKEDWGVLGLDIFSKRG